MMKVDGRNGKDDLRVSFCEVEEFKNFLKERESETERILVNSKKLNFLTLGDSKVWHKTNSALAESLGVKEELVDDTEKNMDMILIVESKPYLIGSSAWISIKNRIDIYGKGFDALGSVEQVRDINKILSQMNEDMQVIVVEGKVRALMSSEYSVVRGDELFSKVLDSSISRFDECSIVEARVNYETTTCKIVFQALQEELSTLYDLPEAFIPGLLIESSDTGHSGNKIGTFWKNSAGNSFINQEDYIYMKHRGKVSIDKIVDELPNLFLKYQDTIKKFADMIEIEITNPVTTLKHSCKKIGITRKHTSELCENFELNLGGKTTSTAYDICQAILSLSSMVDEKQKTDIEEKVGKAINLNYLKISKEA